MTALQAMQNHDANEEIRYIYEGKRIVFGWSWLWLDWTFGIAAYLDPDDKPGVWLNLGPVTVGAYLEPPR